MTLFAAELLKEVKPFIEEGLSPQTVIKGFRNACVLAVNKIKEIAVVVERDNEV